MEQINTDTKKIRRKMFSLDERKEILKKTNCKCAHCGMVLEPHEMTVEHVFPVAKGGTNNEFNLVALCEKCNFEKSNMVYNIRDYYKHIDRQYISEFEEQLFSSMKSVINRNKRMMAEDVRLYQTVNPAYMQMVYQASIRNKKKSYELFKNTLVNIRYELAYEAESEEIFRFVEKNREKNNKNNKMYDNEFKIRELIKYGQVYTLRTPDGTIKGVVGMFNINRHNIDMPLQIENLAEVQELDILHLITIFEISEGLNMCNAMIIYDIINDFKFCNTKLITFTEDDNIHSLMQFSSKIFNMPFNFRNYDGFIQCYTGSGEREVEDYFKSVSNGEDEIEIVI